MIYNFFHSLVLRTHFWRAVGFAEMAELYTSRMLRVMALKILAGFSIVYIYQLGYSLQFIAFFLCGYFLFRIMVTAPLTAVIVARYGPKHAMLLSNILQIIAAFIIIILPVLGPWTLVIYAPIAGFALSLYDVSYLVDFSKVKHIDHSGKELGVMQIFERVMIGLGPLAGGVIAFFFGPQIMMVVGAILMLLAALPLFFSGEPVRTHQKITLRNFNWRVAWRPILANIGVGLDMHLSGIIWSLFLAVVLFGAVGNNAIYAQIGGLGSIAIFASIAISYAYGKMVDNKKGKILLRLSVIGDVVVHLLRPFVTTPVQAIGINVANEVATVGYAIPSTRALFDAADGLPGYRIVYLTIMNIAQLVGDLIAAIVFLTLTFYVAEADSLRLTLYIIAPFILLVIFHNHLLYRRDVLTRFIHRV